jgi:hypothetical protein
MADNTKNNEHVVKGSVPRSEWEKFLRAHFKPSDPAVPRPAVTADLELGGGICSWLGCPVNHPISGTPLKGCTATIEHDGSLTIYCHYEAISAR